MCWIYLLSSSVRQKSTSDTSILSLCMLHTTSFPRQNLVHIFCKFLRKMKFSCKPHHICNATLNHSWSNSLWKIRASYQPEKEKCLPVAAHKQRFFVLSQVTLRSAVSKSIMITWWAASVILEGIFSLFICYIYQWYLSLVVLQAIAMTFQFNFIYLSQRDLSGILWQVRTINNRFPVILKSQ